MSYSSSRSIIITDGNQERDSHFMLIKNHLDNWRNPFIDFLEFIYM